jgi:antitoxin component of MazEF toxin-antitoxin module
MLVKRFLKSISLKKILPTQISHSIEAKVQNIQACPNKREEKGTLVALLNQKQYKNAKGNTKHLPF